jgi:cytochrome c-type biogenesis protein
MEPANLTLSIAFLAGLLSFASPCVLPLVPAYVGYLGGTAVMSAETEKTRREAARTFLHALLFVLGFGLVFVLLGASATFIGRFLFDSSILLRRIGGVVLVVFGMRLMAVGWSRKRWIAAAVVVALVTFLFDSGLVAQGRVEVGEYTLIWLEESVLMGLVVLAGADWGAVRRGILAVAAGVLNYLASFDAFILNLLASALIVLAVMLLNRADVFYAQKQIVPMGRTQQTEDVHGGQPVQSGYLRSLVFGVVFAAGWTPCVGPILAGILIVASQLETVGQGVLLLAAYTLGLGIPFLLLGLAFGPLSRWLRKMNRYLPVVSVISGVLLVIAGILIFTDSLAFLSQYGNFLDIEL